MKPLLIAGMIAAATSAVSAQTRRPPDQVIREDGALVLTDGASYYRFTRDSSFDSGPIGLSGRTITGRWRGGDGQYIVEGRWSWINGQSLTDDNRRMTIYIGSIDGPGTVQSLTLSGRVSSVRVHRAYHYIDGLIPIPPPLGATGAAAAGRLGGNYVIEISTNLIPGVNRVTWSVEDTRCVLGIVSEGTLPPIQVWLLRNDGTVVAPTLAAVMTGGGSGGTGPTNVGYYYDRAVERETLTVVVKLGDEYLIKALRR